ncbi:DNA repair protein RadC (plasmid) [Vibrio scophthalmi]|uniref:RadC family protein n=1 Tax=Vibrio scophthalmi TaxID=45658 RepID=UPI0008095A9C|nr:DNA repair protein RadC [Vibrio scophthalmi]ANS88159.1 UPF0758 protein [Vibrio scophthalmi]
MSYSTCYQPSYGQGKLVELQEAPGEYYQLSHPVTADELMDIALEMANDRLKRGEILTSPEACRRSLTTLMRDLEREVFAVLFLDTQNQLLKFEVLFYGSIDSAAVYPREVVKRALTWNASAVILAHNHPSGVSTPSQADRRITRQLVDALALVDVRVLDHFIVGESITSFVERGWL